MKYPECNECKCRTCADASCVKKQCKVCKKLRDKDAQRVKRVNYNVTLMCSDHKANEVLEVSHE